MNSWEEKTVGEICNVKGGKRLPAGKDFAEGVTPFPYLRVTDMTNGSIDQTSLVYVTPEIEPFIRNYKISKDDIYVTIAGTLGLFGTIPDNLDNAQLTENAAKLCEIDFREFNKLFLKYYFNSKITQVQIWREIGVGGGVPKLALFRIEKLKVKYPEKNIQDCIAKILSTTDAVIEKTQSAIAKYKSIKQGMVHDLFTRGIDMSTGKLRPRYEDAPDLYKESKLGWIPSEWEVEDLKTICSMKSGEGITSERIFEMGDFPVYGGNGQRGFTNSFTHNGEFTLIGRQGALCGNITRVSGKFYASEHAVVVTVANEIEVDWLSQKLDTMNLNQFSEASAQPGLSVNKILKLIVSSPPFNEQKIIALRLVSIDNKLQVEQTYLYKMQHLKQGLMNDLLSGRKEVKVKKEFKNSL